MTAYGTTIDPAALAAFAGNEAIEPMATEIGRTLSAARDTLERVFA